jgi:hypothetical protein
MYRIAGKLIQYPTVLFVSKVKMKSNTCICYACFLSANWSAAVLTTGVMLTAPAVISLFLIIMRNHLAYLEASILPVLRLLLPVRDFL